MTNQIVKLTRGEKMDKLKERRHFQQTLVWIYSFLSFYKEGFLPAMLVFNQCQLVRNCNSPLSVTLLPKILLHPQSNTLYFKLFVF